MNDTIGTVLFVSMLVGSGFMIGVIYDEVYADVTGLADQDVSHLVTDRWYNWGVIDACNRYASMVRFEDKLGVDMNETIFWNADEMVEECISRVQIQVVP